MKVKVPAEVIAKSSPETVKVTSSPSASVAVTVPIAVWFSAALKLASEVNSGAMSLTLVITMLISLSTVSSPSVKDRLIEYAALVSKSGSSLKLSTFSDVRFKLFASSPLKVKVRSSSSGSETDTVVIAVWFSGIESVDAISIEGASLIGLISTSTSADDVLSPWVIV